MVEAGKAPHCQLGQSVRVTGSAVSWQILKRASEEQHVLGRSSGDNSHQQDIREHSSDTSERRRVYVEEAPVLHAGSFVR
jgi:hypothetical protein